MIPIATCTRTEIRKRHEIRLNARKVYDLLADQGLRLPAPSQVEIIVPVPGGNWSNEDLEIGDRSPLVVRWEETAFKETNE